MNELLNNSEFILAQLHFLRADWFYAFIPLLLFLLLLSRKRHNKKSWQAVIDVQLLPFVLTRGKNNKQRRYPLILAFIAASLCITALAGPTYKKLPQPVYREQSALVILLDLSQSMNANDIKPSRLGRAKLELLDILKTRKTGQTALVVYAADAFVVTPLTDDNATIANLAPSLLTEMMPAQGSNLSKALSKTLSLFSNSGIINGDILIITDDIRQQDESAIKKVSSQGHRLSIFGIGTAEGSPIPLDGGFLLDSNGAIVIPKLHTGKLQKYALEGGGLYTGIQADDDDINKLSSLFQSSKVEDKTVNNNQGSDNSDQMSADIWQEEGHWLLLPLIFFAALWSRKGWIAVLLPFAVPLILATALSLPVPAAADQAVADQAVVKAEQQVTQTKPLIDINNLWSSPDQKAMTAFNKGNNKEAAEKFTQPDWKASAQYRNGDFEAAVKTLENSSDSKSLYNKANALARLGKYEEAIKAYDSAIENDASNEDAKYNREQVKQALKKQQEQSDKSEQGDSEQDSSEQDDSSQENSDNESSENENSEQQDSENNDSPQDADKNQQQDQAEPSDEQKNTDKQNEQTEDEQLKQRDAEAEKEQQKKEQQQYEQDQKEQQDEAEEQQADKQQDPQDIENKEGDEKPAEIEVNPVEASITEEEKATEQWLKRIPDDPGGLMRRKFLYQYNQIPNQKDDSEPW